MRYQRIHTDFKNVNLICVKSALKLVLAKKLFCHGKISEVPEVSVFLEKNFRVHILLRSNVDFLNKIFLIPHSTF
jgi:hypothetical protein